MSIALPKPFIESVTREMGDVEACALCEALEGESPTSIRVNPFKMSSPPDYRSIGWSRYGFYLEQRPSFTLDSDFHAGVYYVQEASSQFVGHILSTIPDEVEGCRLLDMCAAPGGKSTLYSTLVGLDGLVVANEINRSRASILVDNIKKWGLGNVVVSSNDSSHYAEAQGWFDIVAVDAPCSGEGMFRKMDEARKEWSEGGVKMCAQRQGEILANAWQALKAGGVLIYSTCTFNRSENEGVLETFCEEVGGELATFESVDVPEEWGVVCGEVGAFQTFRLMPHRVEGEGLFVAVARKSFDCSGKKRFPKARKKIFSNVEKQALRELRSWVNQPEEMTFVMVGDSVYAYYVSQMESVKRLAESFTVIYSGIVMGQLFAGKLKPDAALAQFHDLNRERVSLRELDKEQALCYLRKGDIDPELFAEGVNLITCNGYALGWIKRIGRRVNNLYPNALRILK